VSGTFDTVGSAHAFRGSRMGYLGPLHERDTFDCRRRDSRA
jgi:hypothetical protein